MSLDSLSPQLTRRHLVATGAGALGALTLGRGPAVARAEECVPRDPGGSVTDEVGTNLPPGRIGAQMYSVRDQPGKMSGVPAVLTALAEIGYRSIEFAGINAADIPAIKTRLSELGLFALSNHGAMNQVSLDAAEALGMPYTGIGSIAQRGPTTDSWKQTAAEFNAFGAQAAAKGIKFCPHMHQELFSPVADAPGTYALDVILANTDPELVFLEMDIFWAYTAAWTQGGGLLFDPADWVVAHPKRFPIFHVKDGHMTTRQSLGGQSVTVAWTSSSAPPAQEAMCDVHQGNIDFRTFFGRIGAVSDLNDHHFIWERDSAASHPHGSLSSARASYAAMRHDHLVGPSRY